MGSSGPTVAAVAGAERVEYVLLSDVHMTEVEVPPEPGWWEFKAPEVRQDGELVAFLDALEARRPEAFARTEVIFNGDTFDFDSVFSGPPGVEPPPEGLPSTVPGSVYKMRRLLDDHAHFVRGLARFLARGNGVTFVMGNHDRELCFPEVQAVVRARLAAAAPVGAGARVAGAVRFEPWFVYVPGLFYCEHGQQYDMTCSYRDVLDPLVPASRTRDQELEASFGSVFGRRSLSRVGTFNPFNDESFILSLGGYMRHFFDLYWPRRRLFRPYFAASIASYFEVRRRRKRALAVPRDAAPRYEAYARAKGVDRGFIALLDRLRSTPLADKAALLVHELWLDRWALLALAIVLLALGIANVRTWTQGLLLLMFLPLVTFVFRLLGRGSLALQERGRWGLVAEQIATHLRVPVVAFGHSHRPERRPLARGGRYYNLGTWAPILDSDRGTTLDRARRFLVLRPGRSGLYVAFQRWEDGRVTAY